MADATDVKQPDSADQPPQQLLKMLMELGPLVVFFVINAVTKDILLGTAVFMVTTAISLVASRFVFGHIPMMPLISGVFVLIFGGLTVWLQDALFIKLKPTIVNTLFAAILLSGLYFKQFYLRYILGHVFKLTDDGWQILTIRWALFFLVLAGLNEIVWRNFSEQTWIAFKIMGVIPLTIIFGIAQMGLLRKHAATEA